MCHKQPVPPLPLHLLNQRVLFIHVIITPLCLYFEHYSTKFLKML